MTKRMIPELNTTAFKADELAWLKKVAGLVEEGTYLSSLFTEQLVNWCENQMRNDFPCNLYALLEAARENSRQHESHGKALEADLSSTRQALLKEGQRIEWLKERREEERERNAQLLAAHQHRGDELDKTWDELQAKDDEILHLKARLYDLMIK